MSAYLDAGILLPILIEEPASAIAIARRLDVTLVTLDRRLANAAQALGITVEMPQTS